MKEQLKFSKHLPIGMPFQENLSQKKTQSSLREQENHMSAMVSINSSRADWMEGSHQRNKGTYGTKTAETDEKQVL